MEEEDNIIVKWAQEDVETSYKLLNKKKYNLFYYIIFIIIIIIIIIIAELLSNVHAEIYSPTIIPSSFNRRSVKSAAYCNTIPVFIRSLKNLSTGEIWCLVCRQDRMRLL